MPSGKETFCTGSRCLKLPVPDSPPGAEGDKPLRTSGPAGCGHARPRGPLAEGSRAVRARGAPAPSPLSPSLGPPAPPGPPGPHDPRPRVTSAALPATAAGTPRPPPPPQQCACAARCLMGLVVSPHCQPPALSLRWSAPKGGERGASAPFRALLVFFKSL